MFVSTKTYGHELGLSAVFRQWRADSHCNQLHGYALSFTFWFEADELDDRNWVVDFGGLDSLKRWLKDMFDHTLVIADDDPEGKELTRLHQAGLADVRIVDDVGCEAFAKLASEAARAFLSDYGYAGRVRLRAVECREHGANSAMWEAD